MKIGIRADLIKARAGFTRGGAHKYVRRVRTMVGGKLAWKYYYADDIAKERELRRLKEQAKHDKQAAAIVDEHEHGTMAEFALEQDLRVHEKRLGDLTLGYVQDQAHMANPPTVSIPDDIMADYHTALTDQAEYGDPHGKQMSILRALELSYRRLPPDLKKMLDGKLKSIDFKWHGDDAILKKRGWSARAAWGGGGEGESQIVIGTDHTFVVPSAARRMGGGLRGLEIVIHEMGHCIQAAMTKEMQEKYDQWHAEIGRSEVGVTKYAEKKSTERFAESFAAALLYPKQLAETAPEMYKWLRENVIGEEALPPLNTDDRRLRELQVQLEKNKKNAAKVTEIRKKIDAITGIKDMEPDHPRLTWWEAPATRLQTVLHQAQRPIYADPATANTFHKDDKFYEMSVGGRTVYMRIGMNAKGKQTDWTPHGGGKKGAGRLLSSHIKEIYDEDGKPLSSKMAWWHLHQDIIGDQESFTQDEVQARMVGRDKPLEMSDLVSFTEQDASRANKALLDTLNLHDILVKVGKGKDPQLGRPVEISPTDFRQRSGAFAFDQWEESGAHLIEKLQAAQPGTKTYDKLMDEYRKAQPFVEFETITATQWHVDQGKAKNVGQVMGRVYLTDGGVPRLTMKRFVNTNPDGSKTIIDCERGPDGHYYPRSPVWRALLTPNGGHISSVEDLQLKCRQAMEAGLGDPPRPRRAWVSIRGDVKGKTDSDHYLHMQVEFDGRGQPKVLGDEWKHKLGVDEPRIDDFLRAARATGVETARPVMPAEKIKIGKPRKRRGRELLPQEPGDRVVLTVSTAELGLKSKGADRKVIMRLDRILPEKKAGEPPPEPGWDRMPEGFDDPLPHPEAGEKGSKLGKVEKDLKARGLLPDWYIGTQAQSDWFDTTYAPAYKKWKRTKKAETAKEYAKRYIFLGEVKGGASRKRVIRRGDQAVIDTIEWPTETPVPEPLDHTPLLYRHQTINPINGEIMSSQLRLLLPKDGHIDPAVAESLPGVRVRRTSKDEYAPVEHIGVDMAALPRLREALGGMSLTGEAERLMRAHAEQLREIAERAAESTHVMPLEDIDPAVLARMGVGLRPELSDGTKFKLAHHQAELVQKLIDNNGRVLGAHFMGTGKTISALVAAKLMMARRNPDHPLHDPDAPKKTLIVAPLNTVEQWRQAAIEFDEGATVVGAKSSDIPIDRYLQMSADGTDRNDLVIVGPEYFTQHQKKLREAGFDALVVDEAHMGIKNDKTARNKAISAWNEDMKMMMLLTGTPITTSPSDILEYIKILSQGKQWAGISRAQLEEEFLEESPVPGEAGVRGAKGPKVQIKASKRDELAAILSRWVHVAMGKDVRGKTLPAVRIEESRHAEMIGVQSQLYAFQLAALPESIRDNIDGDILTEDEVKGDARRRVQAAKATANCLAYKPPSTDKVLMIKTRNVDAKGKVREIPAPFTTFGIKWLRERPDIPKKDKKTRKLRVGRWPPVDELTEHQVAIYDQYFSHVIDPNGEGLTYAMVAGQKVTKAQFAAMGKQHVIDGTVFKPWGDDGVQVDNPEAGPLGIKCRGLSERRAMTEEEQALADRASRFRRLYKQILTTPDTYMSPKGKPTNRLPYAQEAWAKVLQEFGVSDDEAHHLMGVPPERYTHQKSITHGGVTVTTNDRWVSDTRGSLHLLFHPDDWDEVNQRPKSAGGFENVEHMREVEIDGSYAWLKRPGNVPEEEWEGPPRVRYREDQGEKSGQRIAVEVLSGPERGAIKWVRKSETSARARSLMDPGMREERAKADIAMTVGNAKSEELMAHIENFHTHAGPGDDRARSMVVFANGILDGCRTVEAALRFQGFRDVNEAIKGSPHWDPDDPGPAPNGKYFVTYIGSTYTGDRELNIEISKKVKDKLGRDTGRSLFVAKVQDGRDWNLWPGGPKHPSLKRSQWTQEQRERIWNQFQIKVPESYIVDDEGRQRYFYGTKDKITIPGETMTTRTGKTKPLVVNGSAGILREMTLTGDPSKMAEGSPEREAAEERLKRLQALYEKVARDNLSDQPPMKVKNKKGEWVDDYAANVMHNCEIMVMSDAAQVGINKGDAVEMVMFDSLASPMAEMQRITRSARMLPPAVRDELMNKYIQGVKGLEGGEFSYAQLSMNPDHPAYVEGATRVDHMWEAMESTGKRPEGMTYVEFKQRAEANGARPGPEEAFNKRPIMGGDESRDANRVTWEKDGKVAVSYSLKGEDGEEEKEQLAWVDRSAITEADGAFRRIRDSLEAEMFDPNWAGSAPPGMVLGASLVGAKAADTSFDEILTQIANIATEQASLARPGPKGKPHRDAWEAIGARARSAQTLGVVSAEAALRELNGMHMTFLGGPGEKAQTRPLLKFNSLEYQEPTEGTYGIRTAAERAAGVNATPMEMEINEPINAVRKVLDRVLSDEDRRRIAKAGFVKQGESGSLDATEIYLAMRAQQVMDGIDRRRPEVARRMRATSGGKVVTEADIMNTIIDELSPMDRAILKSKKYLVNVRRLGASGVVPQNMTVSQGPGMPKTRVFTGYEKEHPVATERATRAKGRARVIPVENLLHLIQQGVQVRTEMDFHETTARDVADMSRLDPIAKALIRLVFGDSIFNRRQHA